MRLTKVHPIRDLTARDTAQDIDANFDAIFQALNELVGSVLPRAAQQATVPLQFKGDLLGHNGGALLRVPVGVDDTVITADASEPGGWGWRPLASPTADGYWTVLTDGDPIAPELVFADGDVIAMFVPL